MRVNNYDRDDTEQICRLVGQGVPMDVITSMMEAKGPAVWTGGDKVREWPGREDDIPRALAHAESNGLRVITLENGDTMCLPKEWPTDNPYKNSPDMPLRENRKKRSRRG